MMADHTSSGADEAAQGLENLLTEDRRFPPAEAFAAQANAGQDHYDKAAADRLGFWADQARGKVSWSQDFTEVLDWSEAPRARWFADGRLNAAYNAVDRHVEAGHGDRRSEERRVGKERGCRWWRAVG